MGVYAELRGFVLTHRECGVLRGATKALERGGFRLAVVCPCGARFGRTVNAEDPDAERLLEALGVGVLGAHRAGEAGSAGADHGQPEAAVERLGGAAQHAALPMGEDEAPQLGVDSHGAR